LKKNDGITKAMNNEKKYNIEYFGKDNGSSFNKLFLLKVYIFATFGL
jgi:hypothetical protein